MSPRERGMSKKEFEEAMFPLTLSEMANYAQEWLDENRPGKPWPKGLEDACSAACWESIGVKNAVTPAQRRLLVDWFAAHY